MQPGSNRSPHPNSLLAGNLAGNFSKKWPRRAILASKTRAASIPYAQIPCSTEQGIFLYEQGILSREQGIWNLAPGAGGRSHPSLWGRGVSARPSWPTLSDSLIRSTRTRFSVHTPSRDWKPTYSHPQNRGYSANDRKSGLAQECVVVCKGESDWCNGATPVQSWRCACVNCLFISAARVKIAWTLRG
jgi:hypothetical protein